METRKLFYEDCNLSRFSAKVTGCEVGKDGWEITLDATAFYPEGGGQAADTGVLGGVRVLHVREAGAQIVHLCDGPLEVGQEVAGEIDWAHRFDLMQQHTGEHILSGLIHKAFGYHNVGFHMGRDVTEIDFDGPIAPEALARLEEQANEAVWANLPLHCWVPAPEELPEVTYRTKRALSWPVRIVEVPGYDTCACCGVHTQTTGAVGLIKILTCVKFHQGVRLEIVCGGRAYRYMAAIFEENRRVSQLFSAKMPETAAAAQKMADALAAEKLRAAGLEKRLLQRIAEGYIGRENVVHFEPSLSAPAVRDLAERLSGICGGFCAIFSGSDEGGYQYCLASQTQDLRQLNKDMTAALNGRGGGKPAFQQGSLKASHVEIAAFFSEKAE